MSMCGQSNARSNKWRLIGKVGLSFLVLLLVLGISLGVIPARGQAAQIATLMVTPATAVPGETLQLTIASFQPREKVTFTWGSTLLPTSITTDASGSYSGSFEKVPDNTSAGSHHLYARGASSGLTAAFTMTVPSQYATASPLVVAARGAFNVGGTGFGAHEIVSFYWDGTRLLGTTVANSGGSLDGAFTYVPANATPGSHVLKVRGGTTHRSMDIVMAVSPSAAATTSTATRPAITTGPALPAGTYHFVGSLVASPGAQVSHVEGILTLQVGAGGSLSGSTLRLTSGGTIAITGAGNQGLLGFNTSGMQFAGRSSAIGSNRLSGLFTGTDGATIGFWVATRIAQGQMGAHFTFTGTIASGPDSGMSYNGTLELWGDTYGGLEGWLTLTNNTVLTVSGQSVNGNVNMLVIVRSGTPLITSGTRDLAGNLHGAIVGPLAGDQGTWTATK